MPFVDDAKNYALTLSPASTDRLILDFLLQNAIGRHNAQPWSAIETYLKTHGKTIRQQTFQQGLLKKSREGSLFIGSNDHGDVKGYFLIQDEEDAEIIRSWYQRRIQVEKKHLDHLDQLMQQQFRRKP